MNHLKTDYLYNEMQTWRHAIHAYPELAFEEERTSAMVADLLGSWGIDVHTGVGGTGVVGVLQAGNSERMIGMRADMDALAIDEQNSFAHRSTVEGRMHACGHDGHTAMLLGAARHLASTQSFNGTVVFIFQPAEEHGRGAKAMIADGLFERFPVQDVYAIHNFPSVPKGKVVARSGPVMASEDNFEIVIKGVGHHAAMPHRGADPIVVASQIVMALQTVVSRSINPSESGVISITEFIADGTVNVVPNTVTLKGDTRSYRPEIQSLIERRMREIAEGICAAHGVSCEFSYLRLFDSTINTSSETTKVREAATRVLGAECFQDDFEPPMTSEDFAFMLQAKPGCYLFLGNDGEGPGGCGLHNPGYDFNDEILAMGADIWVALVEQELT